MATSQSPIITFKAGICDVDVRTYNRKALVPRSKAAGCFLIFDVDNAAVIGDLTDVL